MFGTFLQVLPDNIPELPGTAGVFLAGYVVCYRREHRVIEKCPRCKGVPRLSHKGHCKTCGGTGTVQRFRFHGRPSTWDDSIRKDLWPR